MNDLLQHIFGAVCGQNPDHSWAPGGWLLPCCQRCTGLYVGAFCAALLHLVWRPRLGARFLEVHGAFLLLMVPFGYHWVPQGPLLRSLSGLLFGFAVVTFLWLVPRSEIASWGLFVARRAGARPHPGPLLQGEGTTPKPLARYACGLAAALVLVPLAGTWGGRQAHLALAWLAFGGLVVLAALVLANVACGVAGLLRRLGRAPAAPARAPFRP